jgi:hypothetical protein
MAGTEEEIRSDEKHWLSKIVSVFLHFKEAVVIA